MKYKIRNLIVVYSFLILFCACDTILEDDLKEVSVDLISPFDGAELGNTLVQFQWDSVKEAITYKFQIAHPTFSNSMGVIVTDSSLTRPSATRNLPLGDYEWRVKAVNSNSETEYTTSAFSVTGSGDISGIFPVINNPENSMHTNSNLISVQWENMTGANEYLIRVFDYSNGIQGELINSNLISTLTYSLTLEEGVYIAQLQGSNSGVQLSQMSQVNFTVDVTAPTQPSALSTNGNMFGLTDQIDFMFSSGTDMLSSIKDSIFIYTTSPSALVYSAEATNSFQLSAEVLGAGNYDWSVKTYDLAGNFTESEILLFDIDE